MAITATDLPLREGTIVKHAPDGYAYILDPQRNRLMLSLNRVSGRIPPEPLEGNRIWFHLDSRGQVDFALLPDA